MRLRHNRIQTFQHRAAIQQRDNEGGTYIEYGPPTSFRAEMWASGGKLQAEMYGIRMPNMRNLRIQGRYHEIPKQCTVKASPLDTLASRGAPVFKVEDGPEIVVGDGVCIYSDEPDYRVVAIYPYHFLTLEVEKL